MKRTKENWLDPQPADRNGISSASFFDGEDHRYEARKRELQQQQRSWIEQQIREKEEERQEELKARHAYANFYKAANTVYGQVQDDITQRYRKMQEVVRDSNVQMSNERRERERLEREQRIKEEQEDLLEQVHSRQLQ